jgi:RHS repeat-associated protein
MKKFALLFGLLSIFPFLLRAQTGLPPFGSFTQGGFDTINNQNLNIVFSIPIASSTGRGLPLNLNLSYNSLIWSKSGTTWFPTPSWGWQKDFPVGGSVSYTTYSSNPVKCYQGSSFTWVIITTYKNYVYTDALGTSHGFPVDYWESGCPLGGQYNGGTYPPAHATDGSGYLLSAAYDNPVVLGPNGQQESGGTFTASDVNGNYVTKTAVTCSGCVETDWKNSVGNTALKIIYTPNTTSPTTVQYEFLDGNGNYQTITLKFQSYNIKTNFGCSGITENTTSGVFLPYELDIPSPASGTLKYSFSYEPTPGNSGYYTGRLQQVTLPAGGYYTYTYSATNDGINCSDGSTLSMNRTVNDNNGNSATWNFVRNTTNLTTTVTTPQLADTPNANDTVYTFNSSSQETTRKVYKESPGVNVLRTINTGWAANGTPTTRITILEDGSTQNEVATTYDSNGLLDATTEYDWGSGAPGSALRTTAYTYQTSTNYTSRNLIHLVTSKVVKDGSGTVQYRQDVTYDGVGLASCPTGAAQHDDSGHPCTSNYRGNPTSVTTYTSPAVPSGGITKTFTYDWFGNLLTAQLNCCASKIWTYSSTYQYSQPTQVTSGTSPTQLTTNYTYNQYTGLLLTSTDPNNLVTTYTYDFLRRPSTISQANGSTTGGRISYNYDDVLFTTTTTTTIDSSKSLQQVSSVDGLGRVLVSTTKDGNSNVISKVSATYDLLGRAYKTSNPYTGTASYFTTTAFDVLGRVASVALPDNSTTTYTPAEQYMTVVDPAGKKRKSQVDAAGRLVVVTEPDATNNLNTATYYTYNILDELTGVADAASSPTQTRSYSYDALGRLVSTVTPEGGQTCFGSRTGTTCNQDGYDSFDNLLTRTDARGVVTSYSYDGLNRLKGVSYNVGTTGVPATASVSFTYGTTPSSFNNGLLITMTDGVGSENYSYNALEQLTQLQKVIGTTTYMTSYQYNIGGELTQITYPSGRVIQQSMDAIGRLCEIAPSTTGCGTAASPYATGYGYNVANQITGFKYGNGIYTSLGFSSDRLQLSCLDYSTTNRNGNCAHDATTKFGLTYAYQAAPNNNGLISGITDYVDNGRSVAYTYDPLSRLSTGVTTGSTNYAKWGLSWGYDRYGNRLNQTLTAGSGYQGSVQVTASTNRINCIGGSGQSCSGGVVPTYDANGNMTYDGSNNLVYDAENKAVSATNASTSGTYTFDGNGLRVKKVSGGTTTVYVFSGSKVIAEYDNGAAPTSPSREYVYGGSRLLAKIDSGGTKYYHQDQLSNRLVTDSSGNTAEQMGHYPFGDPWYNASSDKLVFTTYERDSESSNDYAQARFYRWLLGSFLSLDPLSGSTSDPQSLNRYTYVENNPIGAVDPSGAMEDEVDDGGGGGGGGDWGGGWGGGSDGWGLGGGGWCWAPSCYGTGHISVGDPEFSQPITAGPSCLAACGAADKYGASSGGVTYINITLGPAIGEIQGDINGDPAVVGEWGIIYASVFSPGFGEGSGGGGAGFGGGGGGGGADLKRIKASALALLITKPDCAALFGGLQNAFNAIAASSYYNYVPGGSVPEGVSDEWAVVGKDFKNNPQHYGGTFPNLGTVGGTTFFGNGYSSFNSGFNLSWPGETTQLTGFFHELEHAVSLGNPMINLWLDRPGYANADATNINTNCLPSVETQNSPITGTIQ